MRKVPPGWSTLTKEDERISNRVHRTLETIFAASAADAIDYLNMIGFIKRRTFDAMRVRVTPDPETAAALERKRAELDYRPEQGFLFERVQERIEDSTPSLLRRQAG